MSAFDNACRIEAEGLADLVKFLEIQADNGRFILTSKGRLSRQLQLTTGDAMMNKNGEVIAVEFKVEKKNTWGNFFLETWSNRSRYRRGWLDHLDADFIFYYFVEDKELFIIPFPKLRAWSYGFKGQSGQFNPGRIYDYPEKKQAKYEQLNDTWGRTVPIEVIQKEVGCRRIDVNSLIKAEQEASQGYLF